MMSGEPSVVETNAPIGDSRYCRSLFEADRISPAGNSKCLAAWNLQDGVTRMFQKAKKRGPQIVAD